MVPAVPSIEARARIVTLQASGLGPSQIAHRLNVDGVRTPSGRGRWWPQTVTRHVEPELWALRMRRYRATGTTVAR